MGFWKDLKSTLTVVGLGALAVALSGYTGGLSIKALAQFLRSPAFFEAFAKAFLIGTGVSAAVILLEDSPEGNQSRPEALKQTIRSTSTDARFIFGETYINGLQTNIGGSNPGDLDVNDIINGLKQTNFDHPTGQLNATEEALLRAYADRDNIYSTFVLAQHPCESLEGIYLNGQYIQFTAPLTGKGSYDLAFDKWAGKATIHYNLTGDGQQISGLSAGEVIVERINYATYYFQNLVPNVNSYSIRVSLDDGETWKRFDRWYQTFPGGGGNRYEEIGRERFYLRNAYSKTTDTFNGLAYVIIEMHTDGETNAATSNATFWAREGIDLTSMQFHVKGNNQIYNPVTDTREYSNNPAGILHWIISNLTTYTEQEIDAEFFRRAYTTSETNDYQANGFMTTATMESAIPAVAAEMRGHLGIDGTVKMYAGEHTEDAGIMITKEDIVSTADIQLQGAGSHLNQATCDYRDKEINYQANSLTVSTNDEGLRFNQNIGALEFVTSKERAQKTLQWHLNNARLSGGLSMVVYATEKFADIDLFSLATIDFDEIPAIDGKRYKITALQATPQGTIILTLQRYPGILYTGVV